MTTARAVSDPSSFSDYALLDFVGDEIDVSSSSLDYEEQRAQLLELINEMIEGAASWDGGIAHITPGVSETAQRFLRALPVNRELPKVAADGEGDLLFVWEPPVGNAIVTVQDCLIHLVDAPGTAHVVHVDSELFRGRRIPVSILHAIPFR